MMDDHTDDSSVDQDLYDLSTEALATAMSDDFDERQLSAEMARHCVLGNGSLMTQDELTFQGLRVPKTEATTPDPCMFGSRNPLQTAPFNVGISQHQETLGVNPVFPAPEFGELHEDSKMGFGQPHSAPLSLSSSDLEMDRAPSLTPVTSSVVAPPTFQPKLEGQGLMLQETSGIAQPAMFEPKLSRYVRDPDYSVQTDTHHEMWQSNMYAQGHFRLDNADAAMETDDMGITHTVEPDENGECPLHLLSEVSDKKTMAKVIDLVIKCGVLQQCINMQNKYKQTPLFLAVNAGNIPLTGYLLDMGADPNIQGTMYVDRDTYTWRAPIHVAAMKGDLGIVMLQLLLKKAQKMDINLRAHGDKLTALHLALKNHTLPPLSCMETIKALIAAGADVSIREQCSSKTAIILAIETRDLMFVKTFLDLFPAAKRRALLLEQTRSGDTCLHIAAGLSRVTQPQKIMLLRLLVTNGANGSIVNNAKEHPRDFARTEWDSIKTR